MQPLGLMPCVPQDRMRCNSLVTSIVIWNNSQTPCGLEFFIRSKFSSSLVQTHHFHCRIAYAHHDHSGPRNSGILENRPPVVAQRQERCSLPLGYQWYQIIIWKNIVLISNSWFHSNTCAVYNQESWIKMIRMAEFVLKAFCAIIGAEFNTRWAGVLPMVLRIRHFLHFFSGGFGYVVV